MANNSPESSGIVRNVLIGVIGTITAAAIVYVANLHMKQFASEAITEFKAAKKVQEQATNSLLDTQKKAIRISKEIEDAKKGFNEDRSKAQNELSEVREALTNLFGPNAIESQGKESVVAYDLFAMQESISDLVGRVSKLEQQFDTDSHELRSEDVTAIERFVQIEQSAIEVPSKGEKSWYKLTYRVSVNPEEAKVAERPVMDSIERVEYKFSERWFSNPRMISEDRTRSFEVDINVWGRTNVRVEIYLKGVEKPIEKENMMSLRQKVTF